MSAAALKDQETLTGFHLTVLILSFLVLVLLSVNAVLHLPAEVSALLQKVDFAVCLVFFADFWVRFYRAENKIAFMKWGWVDLVASIPNVDVLRVGRIFRILRILQLVRGVRSFQRVLRLLSVDRPRSAVPSVLLATFLMLSFSSVSILICEDAPQSNIRTAEDAVWWSVTTMTTVGYGDRFPVTTEGRVVAMLLMLAGVGLFGTLSGIIASQFIGPRNRDGGQAQMDELLRQVKVLSEKLESCSSQNPNDGTPQTPVLVRERSDLWHGGSVAEFVGNRSGE